MTVKIEKKEIVPICPFCDERVKELIEVKRGMFAIQNVFCCPHCHKILGLSAAT
jgi:hypothetical protein